MEVTQKICSKCLDTFQSYILVLEVMTPWWEISGLSSSQGSLLFFVREGGETENTLRAAVHLNYNVLNYVDHLLKTWCFVPNFQQPTRRRSGHREGLLRLCSRRPIHWETEHTWHKLPYQRAPHTRACTHTHTDKVKLSAPFWGHLIREQKPELLWPHSRPPFIPHFRQFPPFKPPLCIKS